MSIHATDLPYLRSPHEEGVQSLVQSTHSALRPIIIPLITSHHTLHLATLQTHNAHAMDTDVDMLKQQSVSALLTPGSPLALPPTDSLQVSPIFPEIDDSAASAISSPADPPLPTLLKAASLTAMAKGKASPQPPVPL